MNWNGSSVSKKRTGADATETKRITPVFRLKCIFAIVAALWIFWLSIVHQYNIWVYMIPDACEIWYTTKYEPLEAAVLYANRLATDESAEFTCSHLIYMYGEKNGISVDGNMVVGIDDVWLDGEKQE